MEWETMRSMTAWLLLASVHQEPDPSQVTAPGSCAQVTRPGTMPRGTPNGDVGSNKEEGRLLAAAMDRANCRRVISMVVDFSVYRASAATAPVKDLRGAVISSLNAHPENILKQHADSFEVHASTTIRKRGTPTVERPRGDKSCGQA